MRDRAWLAQQRCLSRNYLVDSHLCLTETEQGTAYKGMVASGQEGRGEDIWQRLWTLPDIAALCHVSLNARTRCSGDSLAGSTVAGATSAAGLECH